MVLMHQKKPSYTVLFHEGAKKTRNRLTFFSYGIGDYLENHPYHRHVSHIPL
jgi:hypothetical protein